VSSIDSCHYLYRLSQLDGPPVAAFRGHRAGSFCVKACFSPCGDYLLSGSSDSKAYLWQVSGRVWVRRVGCRGLLRLWVRGVELATAGVLRSQLLQSVLLPCLRSCSCSARHPPPCPPACLSTCVRTGVCALPAPDGAVRPCRRGDSSGMVPAGLLPPGNSSRRRHGPGVGAGQVTPWLHPAV
jgi:hypothetical protein